MSNDKKPPLKATGHKTSNGKTLRQNELEHNLKGLASMSASKSKVPLATRGKIDID